MTSGGSRESEQLSTIANGDWDFETDSRVSGFWSGWIMRASTKRRLPCLSSASPRAASEMSGRGDSVVIGTPGGTVTVMVAVVVVGEPHAPNAAAAAVAPAAPNHARLDS